MNRSNHIVIVLLSLLLAASTALVACQPAPSGEEVVPTKEVAPTEVAPTKAAPTEAAPTEEEAKEPIKIGVISNLTGTETSGIWMAHAVEMAIEDLNATGGIDGRLLVPIIEDAEYRPALGVDAAHKLIDVDKVSVLLNVGGSGIMLPVGEYAASQNIMLINTGASSPQLREISTLCSVIGLDDVMGVVLGEYAYDDGYRTAVTVVPNNPYGIGVQDYATIGFENKGGQVLGAIAFTEGESDYRAEILRIQELNPEVIMTAFYGDDANLWMKQTFEAGLDIPWYANSPSYTSGDIPEHVNDRLLGIEIGWDLPEAQEFFDRYIAKYGERPLGFTASYAYDGMMLVGLAMRQCGPTTECLLEAIPEVAKTYQGVSGRIKLDEDCQRIDVPYVKMAWKDGELVNVVE